ncbi:MAG: hypothetical protein ACYC6Y_19990 [Thermoguttaceae bacterium]
MKPQHPTYQFSIRKLLLWAAIAVAYMGALRLLLNYLRSLGVPSPLSVGIGLTVYLILLMPIRIRWGYARGLRIAILASLLIVVCSAEVSIITKHLTGRATKTILESQGGMIPGIFLGLFLSAGAFTLAHALVVAVDWTDRMMQMKE